MINSLYYHGDERPAADLTAAQLRSARADLAGMLWVDLETPTPEELEEVLSEVFGFHPLAVAACRSGLPQPDLADYESYVFLTPLAVPEDDPPEGWRHPVADRMLALFLGSNYVVTVHQRPLAVVEAMRAAALRDVQTLARGADRFAAELLQRLATAHRTQLEALEGALGGMGSGPTRRGQRRGGRSELAHLQYQLARLQQSAQGQHRALHQLAHANLAPVRAENRVYFQAAHLRLVSTARQAAALRRLASELATVQLSLAVAQLSRTARWLVILAALMVAMMALLYLALAGLPPG